MKDYEPKYPDETEKLTSEFNEAKLQILRLHEMKQLCNSYSRSGNLTSWKWILDCIWRELNEDARKKTTKECDYFKKIKIINLRIIIAEIKKNKGKLYEALSEKETLLRQLQDAAGKGSKQRPADDDGM